MSPEPLAVAFANSLYAVRGQLRDAIASPTQLIAWLQGNAEALGIDAETSALMAAVDDGSAESFRALRTAIRDLLQAATADGPAAQGAVDVVNAAASAAPRWPVLTVDGPDWTVTERTAGQGAQAALAAVAQDAVSLLGSPRRAELRACHGPGCVQFFVKDHPRREWCSAGCGNRARAARHYHRHRGD